MYITFILSALKVTAAISLFVYGCRAGFDAALPEGFLLVIQALFFFFTFVMRIHDDRKHIELYEELGRFHSLSLCVYFIF